VYGQHAIRRTTIDPPALNHYKQLMKRPSSERPIDSAEDQVSRNDLKVFMTMNNPSSELNNDSIVSGHDQSKTAFTSATPLLTNNFTHEAMLLSGMSGKSKAFHQNRANSHFRATTNLNDILSNNSLLETNPSVRTA